MTPTKTNIKKVTKYYYEIVQKPFRTVFLDEYLMKKANKLLYKYSLEVKELLENNKEHLIENDWSLCYPKGKQTPFHSNKPVSENSLMFVPFETRKVENIFDIGDDSIYSKAVVKEIEKLLEKEL